MLVMSGNRVHEPPLTLLFHILTQKFLRIVPAHPHNLLSSHSRRTVYVSPSFIAFFSLSCHVSFPFRSLTRSSSEAK
jgi:hypothetical protein